MMLSAGCVVCLLAAVIEVAGDTTVNYCGARVCGNTDEHTFCQYPEGPSPQCIGYISAELTMEEKSRVIARMNRRRNEAASGRLRDMASAGNMLKLRWVEELAREAQRWADQCRPPRVPEEHDSCRDLYSVSVGQCVASVVGEAPGLRVESMVDIWYMQNMQYKGNATMYIPPSENSSYYGDFAQIMWAQSYMVGCGRSRFMIPWQGRLRSVERLVCNIAPRGPQPARPLWSPSAPATLCPPRSKPDAALTSLCDIQSDLFEEIEFDPSISLEDQILMYTVLDIEQNSSLNYPRSLDEIYLTRLAVATMKNTVATEAYHIPIQKRDVVERIDLEDDKTKTDASLLKPEENSQTSSTSSIQQITYKTKQRVSLIGRPKPYNMEELNDVDYKTENYSPNEELSKTEKDFYPEYEFVETAEENSTPRPNIVNTSESLINSNMDIEVPNEVNSGAIRDTVTILYQNSSILYDGEKSQIGNVNIVYNSLEDDNKETKIEGNISQALKANVEDYLSDPETVRALQEALDRMERDIATEASTERQSKVRRELRDFSSEADAGTIPTPPVTIESPLSDEDQKLAQELLKAEIERNKTLERGPMYNMVLKYMPYLKQYEGGLLPRVSGYGSRLHPSFVLVLLFFTFRCMCILDVFVTF